MLFSFGEASAQSLSARGTTGSTEQTRLENNLISFDGRLGSAEASIITINQQLTQVDQSIVSIQQTLNNLSTFITNHVAFKPGVCPENQEMRGISAEGGPVCQNKAITSCAGRESVTTMTWANPIQGRTSIKITQSLIDGSIGAKRKVSGEIRDGTNWVHAMFWADWVCQTDGTWKLNVSSCEALDRAGSPPDGRNIDHNTWPNVIGSCNGSAT